MSRNKYFPLVEDINGIYLERSAVIDTIKVMLPHFSVDRATNII